MKQYIVLLLSIAVVILLSSFFPSCTTVKNEVEKAEESVTGNVENVNNQTVYSADFLLYQVGEAG